MKPTAEEYDRVERKRWLFLGLPWTFTLYRMKDDMLNVKSGFFKLEQNDCYMYKIVDVKLSQSFMERLCGLGTITCYTGDTTDKELVLKHIKHSEEIKNYLLKTSEEARIKRRTVNMLDIGSGDLNDINDIGVD
ncbi:MAG: PH domain-containing protein [Lachnospiraceae bacterium]|nr:PH domain-containing protein [Lachnospiraceae bacterium]